MTVGLLLAVNETGFRQSQDALETLGRSHATRAALDQMLQSMLNAETGQRGYLLTRDERYLRPYEQAVSSIHAHLEILRSAYDEDELCAAASRSAVNSASTIAVAPHTLWPARR